MVSLALRISDDVKSLFDKLPWVNWSEITREEMLSQDERVSLLDELDELCKNSTLTDEDCLKLGRAVNKRILQRHKSEEL